MPSQSIITFYNNPAVPLAGNANPYWGWTGNCVSSSCINWFARDLYIAGAKLIKANWNAIFTINVQDAETGIRLFACDTVTNQVPQNLQLIAMFLQVPDAGHPWNAPRPYRIDITNKMNELITAASDVVEICYQTAGNNTSGCLLYGTWIECVWQ